MTDMRNHKNDGERGMALITALLATMLVLALGVAVISSTTTDTTTTKAHRVGEQAFFIADAGIGIARRALSEAFTEEINRIRNGQGSFYSGQASGSNQPVQYSASSGSSQFPNVKVIPPYDGTWDNPFYKRVRDRATELAKVAARTQRFDDLNGSSFTVEYNLQSVNSVLIPTSATSAVEADTLRYWIRVTGKTSGGGKATVNETGRISTNINLASTVPNTARSFKFSGFGAFFDNGDTLANAPLAAGTFTGPVHTNTHFAFDSGRNVIFRNVVTQVDSKIRYDAFSSTTPNRSIPNGDITGIDLSTEGFKKVHSVPLPDNNFSQEYAVINSTGIMDVDSDGLPVDPPATIPKDILGDLLPVFDLSGRVTARVLAANLRDASNTAPTVIAGVMANGVYVSSGDGTTITGAGIYVQGNASDIKLIADTNGDQVYVIKQTQSGNTVTTTIRTSYTNNTTSITTGGQTRTFNGVFTDKSDPANHKHGVSLFVNGSINSLRGGKENSTNRAAIASKTKLTITAQRDITITGDLKYANPVANSDGTPVSNIDSLQNVLGIFTNDGNANLAPNSSFVSGPGLSLEMNAAVIAFNSKTSNDGSRIEGSINYTGSTSPGSNDRWKLVGSRVQSKINTIGYSSRDIFFDVRFSGGRFAPPFFPGTSYDLGPPLAPGVVSIVNVDDPVPTAMSWFRDNN